MIHPHMISATGITDRAALSVLENHVQDHGSIYVPKALRHYFGGQERLGEWVIEGRGPPPPPASTSARTTRQRPSSSTERLSRQPGGSGSRASSRPRRSLGKPSGTGLAEAGVGPHDIGQITLFVDPKLQLLLAHRSGLGAKTAKKF
jgi:hypothetical protein